MTVSLRCNVGSTMWMAAIGGAAAAAGSMAWAVRSPRSSVLAPSVHRGDPHRKSIAITFDDGPSESTPRLLEALARHGARATFFHCGANVERVPAVARQVAAAGHELGNHTYSHPMIQFKSSEFIYSEMRRAQSVIEQTAGVAPVLFRAPSSAFTMAGGPGRTRTSPPRSIQYKGFCPCGRIGDINSKQ